LIVGNPFNVYWGMMFTPVFLLGLLNAPRSLSDLYGACARRRDRPDAPKTALTAAN
jgi:hypothetical protein